MEVRWLEQSLADVPGEDTWLSATEKLRCEGLRIPKRRADWRLGRWTAKQAVAAYLGVPCDSEWLARIEIRAAASGAPEVLLASEPANLSISITHRVGISACAVAPVDMTVGCDLELIEPRSEAFLADYFTPTEQATLKREAAAQRVIFSTLLWSAKESVFKVLKSGLRLDTRCLEVSFGESSTTVAAGLIKDTTYGCLPNASSRVGGWCPLTVSQSNGQFFRGWWMSSGELVRTLVTVPSSGPPAVLPAIPR